MEITSLASTYKFFIPLLPYLKKLIIVETFFSLSNEKKEEALDYLKEGIKEEDPIGKYKQKLKLSDFKLCDDFYLNIYILRYYLENIKERGGFCKSLFLVKGFYTYENSEVKLKRNLLWLPFLMFFLGLLAGYGALLLWCGTISYPMKWLYVGGCAFIFIQYVYYSLYSLLNYIRLKLKVEEFNFLITLYRLDEMLNKL
ncbi:hypothetical protein [Enterobacter sp. HSTU-ASh6]|uniref:hypothetical protein n=1 Tax=Enterobacter sp. HSTU-ASh6 TaxID=2678687 RepID=UPI0022525C3D|nr:hypothetical protein [Enterobacter sp. HSTU-ASh6]MCX4181063.1 hypothetical protein [Enterobacter sp. HSTU-ASh6]